MRKTINAKYNQMIRKIANVVVVLTLVFSVTGCDILQQVAYETATVILSDDGTPSNTEVVGGLKEALLSSTLNSVTQLGADQGFLNNSLVKVPFPQELDAVKSTLTNLGLESVVDAFVKELNKGAEKAVIQAKPIFENAIREMSFQDAMGILLGDNNAATNYFSSATRSQLYTLFAPEVTKVLAQYGIDDGYSQLMDRYNMIPFVKQVNTDLTDYVTQKTLDGLFLEIANQEKEIRTNMNVRSTDLLKKVFAYADLQKAAN